MPKPAPKVAFTKPYLASLPPAPKGKRQRYGDAKVAGLVVEVTDAGTVTFYVYRRAPGRTSPVMRRIGPWPAVTIEQARSEAEAIIGDLSKGGSGFTAPAGGEPTVGELFAWWMEGHAKPRLKKPEQYAATFRRCFGPIQGLKPQALRRGVVVQWHTTLGSTRGQHQANRALALLSTVVAKAQAAELWPPGENPTKGVVRFKEQARDRRLSPSDMPAFMAALEAYPNDDLRDFVKLALFTGARKGNLLALRWEDVDWGAGSLRLREMKAGGGHTLPLMPQALEVLSARRSRVGGPWVFPTAPGSKQPHRHDFRWPWASFCQSLGLKDLHIHDLRRTLGSFMVDTGASLPTIGQALHHSSPSTTAIYARMAQDPVRQAMAKAVGAMVGEKSS